MEQLNNGKWFKTWENGGLLAWTDRNGDGKSNMRILDKWFFKGKPEFDGTKVGTNGHRSDYKGNPKPAENSGKLKMKFMLTRYHAVLANPEIANLPNWVIAFIAAGLVCKAALIPAAGLLLVIASSISSHDLMGQVILKTKNG